MASRKEKILSKSSRTLVKEQPHHEKAFEYYYGLGEKRSYEKVAKEFKVSPSTVKLLGKSLRWQERLAVKRPTC